MEERNFIFYPNWVRYIDGLESEKEKLDLLDIIVHYGCFGEYDSNNLKAINEFENLMKYSIDKSGSNYQQKIDNGKNFGRKKIVDDNAVLTLAKSGMKAKQIAEKLNISVDAIYHSDGWKNRNL